jgi:predicted Zn-dependent protease
MRPLPEPLSRRCVSLFRLTLFSISAVLLTCHVVSAQSIVDPNYRSPQSIDSTKAAQKKGNQVNPMNNLTNAPTEGQRIFEGLFRELDNMIPGEFEPGSEAKKSIENAITAFQMRDVSQVESILKKLAETEPGFPPADLLLATLSYAVQDAKSGLLLLERAAVNHPDYPGIYTAFARLAINQGRLSDALAMLEKCERKIGSAENLTEEEKEFFNAQCLDGLTDVAMRQGRLDDAREYLEQQRASLPENAKVLMVSAELEFKQGDIDESQNYLRTLKEKFPATRAPETILASWFSRSGKTRRSGQLDSRCGSEVSDEPASPIGIRQLGH